MVDPQYDANLRSPDHFIQILDFGFGPTSDGRGTVSVRVAAGMCDIGLAATLVDVAGGQAVLHTRFPILLATTHIEVHGIDRLTGSGELEASTRIIGMSKRRAVTETTLRLDGQEAIATAGFAIRDDENVPPLNRDWGRQRRGLELTVPLRDLLGVVMTPHGATVELHPGIHNHVGGLQGGATVALLEAAAISTCGPGTRFADASANYLGQVRGDAVDASVVRRDGGVVTVDAIARPGDSVNTRVVLRIA